jgi:predicted ABC-type ATPase
MAAAMTEDPRHKAAPTIHVIAGPNGVGKTTFARTFLPAVGCRRFLNADLMAAGLSPLSPSAAAIRAARLLLTEWDAAVRAGADFGFETTMSGRAYVARLSRARRLGFQVQMYYLWLPAAAVALRRIRQRVAKGGHDVPVADVKRRFRPSLENFFRLYLPLADVALLFDGSGHPPKLVAEIRKGRQTVRDEEGYARIQRMVEGS